MLTGEGEREGDSLFCLNAQKLKSKSRIGGGEEGAVGGKARIGIARDAKRAVDPTVRRELGGGFYRL